MTPGAVDEKDTDYKQERYNDFDWIGPGDGIIGKGLRNYIGRGSFQTAGGAGATEKQRVRFTKKPGDEEHHPNQHKITEIPCPRRKFQLGGGCFRSEILEQSERTSPSANKTAKQNSGDQ